jgi:hypothetical protein
MGAKERVCCAAIASIVVAATAGTARADGETDFSCVSAFESAQAERMRGKLVSARGRLPVCLAAGCPERVRDDCARMRDELDRSTPSATFAVRAADGTDLDATLTVDGAAIDLHAGRAQLLDPGVHVVTFAIGGEAPHTSRVTIYEGEKSRLIVLHPDSTGSVPPPREREEKRNYLLPVVLGSAGLAFAATSVYFAARSIDDASQGAALAHNVPAGVAPCQDSYAGKADPKFCDADKDRRMSTAVSMITGVAATGALVTAVALALYDKPKTKPRTALVMPLVSPTISGASVDLSF